MEQINDFFDRIASPLNGLANWLLRLGLGIAFFLHGYGKLPISEGFVGWLGSKGVPIAETAAYMVCLLYTSPSPRDVEESRMPSSA